MGDDTMMPISANVRAVPRSGIRDVFDRVIGIDDVISLCVGEPSRTAAPHVVEAAAEAAREGKTRYSNILGISEFRKAAADYSRRVKGLTTIRKPKSKPWTVPPSACFWPSTRW